MTTSALLVTVLFSLLIARFFTFFKGGLVQQNFAPKMKKVHSTGGIIGKFVANEIDHNPDILNKDRSYRAQVACGSYIELNLTI